MEADKKKRSPNYTNEEKENLLSIVTKYKSEIDCKKTGAFFIQKKKEAWSAITKEYNSICTTGPRDGAMLKHFYNNIKHRARKVTATLNKQRYLAELPVETGAVHNIQKSDIAPVQVEFLHPADEKVTIDENKIKDLKIKWIDEKKNIKKTGGGSYDSLLTDADHQILSIVDNHIHPDTNPYDDAAEYFGETIELTTLGETATVEFSTTKLTTAEDLLEKMQIEETQTIKPTPKKYSVPQVKPRTKHISLEYKNKSVELLKKTYFKKKIELVYYQKKNEMQKFRHEQIKHNLQIKILKKQLEKAEKDKSSIAQ